MMYFLRQLRATIYAITVLHYVATCSRHIHVTNANNPELKTLTQKLLHLTRYAPTSMLMKLNIVSSTEHVYCTYEFSIVCSFAFSALSLLVGNQKAIQSVKTFASKYLVMLIMWGWGIVWSTMWVISTCLHRKKVFSLTSVARTFSIRMTGHWESGVGVGCNRLTQFYLENGR